MEYTKPYLSCTEQAEKLIRDGLEGNKKEIALKLASVSYYRLSAYWYPFRSLDPISGEIMSRMQPGTTFETVWNHYLFDRKLRLLFMDAIERIEVALRAQLVDHITRDASPFDYVTDPRSARRIAELERQAGIVNGTCDFKNCKYAYVQHFFRKYGDCHDHLPFWMFAEVTEFGFMSICYQRMSPFKRTAIATAWGLTPSTLISWLSCINALRNACAHHNRVWNNGWGLKPKLPGWSEKRQRAWYCTYSQEKQLWVNSSAPKARPSIEQTKTAALLFICRYLLRKIAPQSHWHKRVEELFAAFDGKGINWHTMGLPRHWQRHPIWQDGPQRPEGR